MAKVQAPSVGRVVHYVAHGSKDGTHPGGICRAAIVTETPTSDEIEIGLSFDTVGLCVLNPSGIYFNWNVHHDEEGTAGSWHWPEFVAPIEVPE